MISMNFSLSKSTYLRGRQCEKSLYLHKFHPNLRNPEDERQRAIFSQGIDIGRLAQDLFPEGIDCSFETFEEINQSIKDTSDAIERGQHTIYEAAFRYDNILVFIDILVNYEDGWKMYEVKSSTSVKSVYIHDASLQSYVLTNCGIDLKDISIVHINNRYVRNGDLDIGQLFSAVSIKDEVDEIISEVPEQINYLRQSLKSDTIPHKPLGNHCWNPYACDFSEYCWKEVPAKSVFEVSGLRSNRKFQLYDGGTELLVDIPDDFRLSDRQRMQVEGERTGKSNIDKEKIQEYLDKLTYPLYFLDFETINPAVPLFDLCRPYEQIPFQYSLHILEVPGSELIHKEYLAQTDGTDPRIRFTEQLVHDCGKKGDIIVYNKGFEKGKITALSKVFSKYSTQLKAINDRLLDLMVPFQRGWYYTPEMHGSYSIKYVLPALIPDLSYRDMEIGDGGTASRAYLEMATGEYQGDHEKLRGSLLEYCKMDTLAMVKILEHLHE